ncbi:hypothetical protein U1Q18_045160 [Sarracenia purpurea var. burkii]
MNEYLLSSVQKPRLEPYRREQMLQRNEAGDEERLLGKRFRQGNDERGGDGGGEDESSGDFHQHHATVGAPNRRPPVGLQRVGKQVADRRATGRSHALHRLHPLVLARSPRYLESDSLRALVATGAKSVLFSSLCQRA